MGFSIALMGKTTTAIQDNTVASTLAPDIDRTATGKITLQQRNSDNDIITVLVINDLLVEEFVSLRPAFLADRLTMLMLQTFSMSVMVRSIILVTIKEKIKYPLAGRL